MPDNKVYFKAQGQLLGIPSAEVEAFKADVPDAEEVKIFTAKNPQGKLDTLGIPLSDVDAFLKDVPDAKPFDVGKPETAPLPGGGGGLSSDMTPGMDGGAQPLPTVEKPKSSLYDISGILKGAGIDSLPENDDIEVTQKKVEGPALKTITDVSGKPVKLEVTETEVKAEPTPPMQPSAKGEEALIQPPSMGLDMATLMPETDKQYKILEFSGKKVLNPFVNLKENVEKINKEQDTEKRSYEYGKLYNNIIDYNNSLIENMDAQAASIQQYAQSNADQLNQINQQLQDPNVPNEQKIQLEQNASQLTANLLGSEEQLKTIEANRAKNIEQNNKLNTYKNLLDYNLDTWDVLLGSTYNGSVISLLEGINSLVKFANSVKYDAFGLALPVFTDDKNLIESYDKYKEVFKNNDYNKIAADNASQLIDKITYKADISRNPGLDKTLTDDLNKANVANFLGSLLGSVGSTMAGGGSTIALQTFGGMYNVGKEAGLNDSQAGLFSIPIAVVAGYLAPLGTEKFLSKIASKTGKQQLITAIKSFGAKTPTQLWNKSLDYAKGVAKGVLEEGAEGFSEQATEEASRKVTEMFTGVDLSKDSFYQSFANSFENGFLEAAGGGIMQLGLGLVPGMKYGKLSRIVTEAMTNPKAEQTTMTDLQNAYRSNKITEEQYNTAVNIFNKAKQATTQLPPNVKDPRAIAKSVQLILNQEEVQQKLETVNPAMREGLDKELKDINQQLADLAGGKVPDVMPDEEKVIKEPPKEKETAPAVAEVKTEEVAPAVAPTEEAIAPPVSEKGAADLGEVKAPEVSSTEALKDVESTAKALEGVDATSIKSGRTPIGNGKFVRYNPDDVLPLLKDFQPTNTEAVEDYVNQTIPNDASIEAYKLVPIDAITPSEKIEKKDRDTIEKIKEGIKRGDDSPPIVLDFSSVIKNGEQYGFGIMDGHHRYIAYKELGVKEIPSAIVTSREHYTFETNDEDIKTLFDKNKSISEAYHADKAAGKETELTKAVESLLGKPAPQAEVAVGEEITTKTKPSEVKTENVQPVSEGVQGVRTETEGREVSPELRAEEEAKSPITVEDFKVLEAKGNKGRDARAELKDRIGEDNFKKMDKITKQFDAITKDLEAKGLWKKICP